MPRVRLSRTPQQTLWLRFLLIVTILAIALAASHAFGQEHARWVAEPVNVLRGFDAPENVALDPASDLAYVTNIEGSPETYWSDDGTGFISRLRLSPAGAGVQELRWTEASAACLMNAPKGCTVLGDLLWFTDNTLLRAIPLKPEGRGYSLTLAIPGAGKLNDTATDGKRIWFSDTVAGKIHCFDMEQGLRTPISLPGANGLVFSRDRFLAVSWENRDVYELDPTGKTEPKPLGLSEHFKSLDGIGCLEDGTILVSDYVAGTVSAISPDARLLYRLVEGLPSAADFAVDHKRSLLLLPVIDQGYIYIYKLNRQEPEAKESGAGKATPAEEKSGS